MIAPAPRVALLGYPDHTNPGDHAVWLGAKSALARAGASVVYECSWRDYSREALAAAVSDGAVIVFTGGGNFGDLWPATHALRERVLADFVGVRVVQLQQSVHFEKAENVARTRALLHAHENVTVVLRDEPSLEFVRRSFDVDVALAPDLAFACPADALLDATVLDATVLDDALVDPPKVDIVWIARSDRESRGLGPDDPPSGVWRVDWNLREAERVSLDGEPPVSSAMLELLDLNRSMTKAVTSGNSDSCHWRNLAAVRDQLTHARLDRSCRLLRRGRVIVTDSLHAHILGVMLGIPTVVTDNSYGKLRGTFEAFTHEAPLARWADTPAEALTIAGRGIAELSIYSRRPLSRRPGWTQPASTDERSYSSWRWIHSCHPLASSRPRGMRSNTS